MSIFGMKCLSHLGYVPGFNFSEIFVCKHCLYGKQTISSHKGSNSHKAKRLQLVNMDMCGPMPAMFIGGALYFETFIDDYSRKVWACVVKRKDKVLSIFKIFVTLRET